MNERDQHQEKLAQLQLVVKMARREHYSLVATAMTTSAAVIASLPMAFSQDVPGWLTVTFATAGALGSTIAIRETETTQADLNEAKKKVQDYQAQIDISRLRS